MSLMRMFFYPLKCLLIVVSLFLVGCSSREKAGIQVQQYDIIVYGGTSAGVTSAVQAKRMGKSVAIVCPDKHLGGLSSGGLGK